MGTAIAAMLILATVFGGISLVIGTVAFAILFAHGKITLPGTEARRLQHEQVAVEIMQCKLEKERIQTVLDAQIDLRLGKALIAGTEES